MQIRNYFPLGKAHAQAFCNRETETEWLLGNIQAGKHSLLMAPRRFGKSSLADRVIAKSTLPMIGLNFNTCSDEHDVEALLRQGISDLISRTLGTVEKIMHAIKNYVGNLDPKISLGPEYARLELTSKQHSDPSANIEDALNLLENLLKEKKQSAVLLLDEFQVVGHIAKGSGVEAAIRNAAQETQQLALIFSGSNRYLLQTMFEDKNRPLYKLCRKLHLKRIEEKHYQKHLNKAAAAAWGKNLSETAFDEIMKLSERHPYYVNYLCDVIWSYNSSLPSLANVREAWQKVLEEEYSDTNAELSQLSMGQKKILKHIAQGNGENLLAASTIKEISMAPSSISGALNVLLEKDVIERTGDVYQIINPLLRWLFL